MKTRSRIVLLVALGVLVLLAATVTMTLWLRSDTTLEFSVRDAVSGRWVWMASMHVQDRARVGFFQSDTGLRRYRFTHLIPGATTLNISAAGYQEVSIPLTLRRGANTMTSPVSMIGLSIPDLSGFYIFERIDAGDIVGELRPVDGTGATIVNHPCMDLWVGCRVSVQLKDGEPALEETDTGAARGRELFQGEIPWAWDPAPEKKFRYSVRIPGALTKQDPSHYRVIDYLIVEPDPLKITREELAVLMGRLYSISDPSRLTAALDAERGRLHYFIHTSWNVKARQE
jgi:hypothetical protein